MYVNILPKMGLLLKRGIKAGLPYKQGLGSDSFILPIIIGYKYHCRLITELTTLAVHYENTPIQIYRKFHLQKIEKNSYKNSDIFHISAQNIDCGYSLEPPRRGGSNEYPQSIFF